VINGGILSKSHVEVRLPDGKGRIVRTSMVPLVDIDVFVEALAKGAA
jgi:hypothetical protein